MALSSRRDGDKNNDDDDGIANLLEIVGEKGPTHAGLAGLKVKK